MSTATADPDPDVTSTGAGGHRFSLTAAADATGFTVGAPRTADNDHAAPERAPGRTPDLEARQTELEALRADLLDAQHRAALAEAQQPEQILRWRDPVERLTVR